MANGNGLLGPDAARVLVVAAIVGAGLYFLSKSVKPERSEPRSEPEPEPEPETIEHEPIEPELAEPKTAKEATP